MPKLDLQLSEGGNILLLTISPDEQQEPVTEETIRSLFLNSEHANYQLNETSIQQALDDVQRPKKPAQAVTVGLAERHNASVEIEISEDNLQPSAHLTAAYGGMNAHANNVIIAARQAGVGVDLIIKNIVAVTSKMRSTEPGDS